MQPISLTAQPQPEAQAIDPKWLAFAPERLPHMAPRWASQSAAEFFGKTAFELREWLHGLGTDRLNAARDERKTGAPSAPPASAPPAEPMPDSRVTPGER
jgi:hypothetical protein